MEKSYLPRSTSSDSDASEDENYTSPSGTRPARYFSVQNILIFLLIMTNIITIANLSVHSRPRLHTMAPSVSVSEELAVVDSLPEMYTVFHWWTAYGSRNHTRDNTLWDAINPSHGFIAVDHKDAAARNWPATVYLPSDESKGVYLLEAYHQLHCLVSRLIFSVNLSSFCHLGEHKRDHGNERQWMRSEPSLPEVQRERNGTDGFLNHHRKRSARAFGPLSRKLVVVVAVERKGTLLVSTSSTASTRSGNLSSAMPTIFRCTALATTRRGMGRCTGVGAGMH